MTRKHKILDISGQILLDLFLKMQRGEKIEIQGLPEDAEFVGANWDFSRATFRILIRSESFSEVTPNSIAPEIRVTMRTVEKPLDPHGVEAETGFNTRLGRDPMGLQIIGACEHGIAILEGQTSRDVCLTCRDNQRAHY